MMSGLSGVAAVVGYQEKTIDVAQTFSLLTTVWDVIPQLHFAVTVKTGDSLLLVGGLNIQHNSTCGIWLSFEVDSGATIARTMMGLRSTAGPVPIRNTEFAISRWMELSAGDHTIDFYALSGNVNGGTFDAAPGSSIKLVTFN